VQPLLVDGFGALHPRRCGSASHLGALSGLPTGGAAVCCPQVLLPWLLAGAAAFPRCPQVALLLCAALKCCCISALPTGAAAAFVLAVSSQLTGWSGLRWLLLGLGLSCFRAHTVSS
jgi:hypothetical protein